MWRGRSTVRKTLIPGREQDAQEANAGGRKATGNRERVIGVLRRGFPDNWPDTGARQAPEPERVLTWAGELLESSVADVINRRASWTPMAHTRTAVADGRAAVANGPEGGPGRRARPARGVGMRTARDNVRRLRQRIFKAAQAGDHKKVRNLQKLMLRSHSNTLVSVGGSRELNAGRATAGVDGEVALTDEARAELVDRVHTPGPVLAAPAGQAGVHPEGRCRAQTPTARHSRDLRPGAAGPGEERVGTRVGSPVRDPLVRVPAGPGLSRRDRGHLQHAARAATPGGCGSWTRT